MYQSLGRPTQWTEIGVDDELISEDERHCGHGRCEHPKLLAAPEERAELREGRRVVG